MLPLGLLALPGPPAQSLSTLDLPNAQHDALHDTKPPPPRSIRAREESRGMLIVGRFLAYFSEAQFFDEGLVVWFAAEEVVGDGEFVVTGTDGQHLLAI